MTGGKASCAADRRTLGDAATDFVIEPLRPRERMGVGRVGDVRSMTLADLEDVRECGALADWVDDVGVEAWDWGPGITRGLGFAPV